MNILDSKRKDNARNNDLEMTQGISADVGLKSSCSIMTRALVPAVDEVIRTGEMRSLRLVWTLWRKYCISVSMKTPLLSSLNSFGMASGRMPIFLTGMCKEPLNKVASASVEKPCR